MPRKFSIKYNKFYQGFSPTHFENSLSEFGNSGHANDMTDVNILDPTYLTQGPGLSDLTNGTQAGAVSELINFVLDKAVSSDKTYGIGPTKLFEISSTTVSSGGDWPHTITDCTDGESVIHAKGNLYYFFNKSSGGDIGKFDLSSTFDDNWGSTVPTGAAALQKAPHPSAYKEDLIVFGNGQYVGVYTISTNTINMTKLDFGDDAVVVDVWFDQNYWWIMVNNPDLTGDNRSRGQIYIWDGAALDSLLEDETAVGVQRLGFGFVVNGITYIAFQDLSSTGGYKIGYLAGNRIKTIGNYTGGLPNFAQKTLYKNTILFNAAGKLWSCGAISEELPIQISQIADGGHGTVGAVAAPFGTPMIASTDGSTNHRLAKFSGYVTSSDWTSLITPLVDNGDMGIIDEMVVLTNHLGANARADITLKYNQEQTDSEAKTIDTDSQRRHVVKINSAAIEDIRLYISWANGNTTNPCSIREVLLLGHYVER